MLGNTIGHLTAIPSHIWNRSDETARAAKAAIEKFSGLASTVSYISKYPAIIAGAAWALSAGFKAAAKNDKVTFIKQDHYDPHKEGINKTISYASTAFKCLAAVWVISYATRTWVAPFASGLIR